MRVRDGCNADRVRRRARRADAAHPEVVAVVSGGDHGHDSGGAHVADDVDHRVVRGLRLGPAAGEVDDVHPVAHCGLEGCGDLGRVGDVAAVRQRNVEDPVVADVGAWRDTGQAAGRRMVTAARRAGSRIAGGDPCDVGRVERRLAIDRQTAAGPGIWAGKRARDDHLGCRPLEPALGKPGGIRVARRVQEWIRAVDAVVDDRDLQPVALGPCQRLQLGGADHRCARVGREVVAQRRIDLADEAEPRERGQLRGRQRHGEPVENDLEATTDACLRDRAQQLRCGAVLNGSDAGQVETRGAARDVELLARAEPGEAPARAPPREARAPARRSRERGRSRAAWESPATRHGPEARSGRRTCA